MPIMVMTMKMAMTLPIALERFCCCYHNVVVRVSSDVSMRTNVASRHSKHIRTHVHLYVSTSALMYICAYTSPPTAAH